MNIYRKVGGGVLRIDGKTINSGDTFQANTIPQGCGDIIKLVRKAQTTPKPPEDTKPESPEPEETYTIYTIHYRGYGWYDILNADGDPVNEDAMRKDEAEQELKKLNNGTETT